MIANTMARLLRQQPAPVSSPAARLTAAEAERWAAWGHALRQQCLGVQQEAQGLALDDPRRCTLVMRAHGLDARAEAAECRAGGDEVGAVLAEQTATRLEGMYLSLCAIVRRGGTIPLHPLAQAEGAAS